MADDLKDTLHFASNAYDELGALANPTTVALTITLPDLTTVTPSITNPPAVTGKFFYDYPSVQSGRHVGVWLHTFASGKTSSYVEMFDVAAPDPGYLMHLNTAKRHLNIPTTSTSSDEELRGWMAATTRIIERIVGPVLVRTVTDERHDCGPSLWLRQPPVLVDAAGLAAITVTPWLTTGTTYAVADLRVSESGRVERRDGGALTGGPFSVTYQAGRRVIPANISGAGLIVLKGLWETQRGAAGLPFQGDNELIEAPGMGPVMWRAKQLLEPDELLTGFA